MGQPHEEAARSMRGDDSHASNAPTQMKSKRQADFFEKTTALTIEKSRCFYGTPVRLAAISRLRRLKIRRNLFPH